MVAAHYREHFAAYAIRQRDILLRFPNRRLCIGPHVKILGLHVQWEKRLTRWTLGVRHALEESDVLPLFRRRRQTRWGDLALRWRVNR